jgi:thioesterase domain-containing protein
VGATKDVVRISLARLLQLTTELGRDGHGPVRVRERRGGPALVPIREPEQSAQPPLFLIHPVGGSVIAYFELARSLRSDQPVYAIENQVAFSSRTPWYETVEEMAAAYLEIARPIAGRDPYLLGGYSMGGLLAFEMARQADSGGCSVPLVAIIDTPVRLEPAPGPDSPDELSASDLLTFVTIAARRAGADLGLDADELASLEAEARIARVLAALQQRGIVPPEVDHSVFADLVASVKQNDAAQRRYQPGPYTGRVDLLRAAQSSGSFAATVGGAYDDPTFGWQEVCTRPIEVSRVPGSHLRLMDRPYVSGVGTWLQRRIDRALTVFRSGVS